MRNSVRLFTVRGIDIRLHFTFPLILLFAAVQFGLLVGSVAGALFGIAAITILFAIVTLHELGHSFAAQRYGVEVKQIVLSPLGGVAQLSEMPDDPKQELVVAAAGPAVNGVLALLMLPLALTGGLALNEMVAVLRGGGELGLPALFTYVFFSNILVAAFNLLPAFPLDGGRILRALLALRLDYVKSTNVAAIIGRAFAVAMGIYGLLSGGIFIILIAVFVYMAAGQEAQYVRHRAALKGYRVEHVYSTSAYRLHPDLGIRQAADLMLLGRQSDFAVVDEDNNTLLGFVTHAALLGALQSQRPFTPVSEIMRHEIEPVHPRDELVDVEMRLMQEGLDALPVVGDDGRYLGLVTRTQIGTLRRLSSTLPDSQLTVRPPRGAEERYAD